MPAWVHQFTGLSGIRDVKEVLTLAEILDSASRRETARALHPLPADPGHPGCRDEGRKLGEGGAGEHAEVPGQQQYACIDKRLIKRFRQGWNNRAALMKGTEGFGAFCTRSPRRWEPEHDAIAQRNGAEQPPPSSELDLSRVGWWPQYVQFLLAFMLRSKETYVIGLSIWEPVMNSTLWPFTLTHWQTRQRLISFSPGQTMGTFWTINMLGACLN